MSPILTIITVLAAAYVVWGLIKPSRLYRFDCAVSLMFLAWVIPEMIIVETTEFRLYFDYTFAWGYILACQICAYLGFIYATSGRRLQTSVISGNYNFDIGRANFASAIIIVVGLIGFFLMAREAEYLGISGEWTGVITFYYLIGQFILYGGALAWLLYLKQRQKTSLIIFLLMLAVAVPVVLYLARRGILFQVGFAIFAGAYFVRKYTPPRIIVVVGLLLGVIILNTAGNIRGHIEQEDGTLITSITSGAAFDNINIYEDNPAPEIKGALTDIEITRDSGEFEPFRALWNLTVLQYTPAFIFGRDFKDSLMVERQKDTTIERFAMTGATRTGFAEAYTGYWYFGILIYFGLGIYQGRLWASAGSGDIRSQYYYIIIMNYSLLTITESISRFVVTLPIIYGIGYLVFRYIEQKPQPNYRQLTPAPQYNR